MLELMQSISTEEKESIKELNSFRDQPIFKIELDRVIEERCDELDYLLEDHEYEILHRVYKELAINIFHYTVFFKLKTSPGNKISHCTNKTNKFKS